MRGLRNPGGNRRGATLVEFAVCFPVLLGFVFGIIEFARVLQIQHTIRLAAFEGARAGVNLDATTADVQTAAQNMLTAAAIGNSQITIVPNPLTYTTSQVSVTVSANPLQNSWVSWFVTSGTSLTGTIALDREVQSVSNP